MTPLWDPVPKIKNKKVFRTRLFKNKICKIAQDRPFLQRRKSCALISATKEPHAASSGTRFSNDLNHNLSSKIQTNQNIANLCKDRNRKTFFWVSQPVPTYFLYNRNCCKNFRLAAFSFYFWRPLQLAFYSSAL